MFFSSQSLVCDWLPNRDNRSVGIKEGTRIMTIYRSSKQPAKELLLCFCLIVFLLIFFSTLEGYTGSSPRYIYLIPEGYTGYVQIEFKVINAPPLPREGQYFLIKVPPSGIVQTSSDMIASTKLPYQRDEFFYYTTAGERRSMVYPACGGGSTRQKKRREEISWIFFIGTCADFVKLKERIFRPGENHIIGPQKLR